MVELTIDLGPENRREVALNSAIDTCPIISAWINRGVMGFRERESPVGETDTAEDATES